MDSPVNTPGIQDLFNLTVTDRKDADIHVRWQLTVKKKTDEELVSPEREQCWIVDDKDLNTKSTQSDSYYSELAKHITLMS